MSRIVIEHPDIRLVRPVGRRQHAVGHCRKAAAQMIELIAMLQEKTRGNLEPAESKLLEDLLYDLRMRFVQAQQQPRIVHP